MCHSDTLTRLIKHLFQQKFLTKSVLYVTTLKYSLPKSIILSLVVMKTPGRIHMHKIKSLQSQFQTLFQSVFYFKPFSNYFSNDLSIMYLVNSNKEMSNIRRIWDKFQ